MSHLNDLTIGIIDKPEQIHPDFIKICKDAYDNSRFKDYFPFDDSVLIEHAVQALLSDNPPIFIALLHKGSIRGALISEVAMSYFNKKKIAQLIMYYIDPNYRSWGVSTHMIDYYIEECKRRGVSFAQLDHEVDYDMTLGTYYYKLGFVKNNIVYERRVN